MLRCFGTARILAQRASEQIALKPYTRISQCAGNIRQQIHKNQQHGINKHNSQYQRDVLVETGIDENVSQTGDGEYFLHNK